VTECSLTFLLTPHWKLSGKVSYSKWEAEDGDDKTFFSDGTSMETELNEVNWETLSFMAGISYDFF